MKRVKYITDIVSIANLTPADTVVESEGVDTDKEYSRVDGFAVAIGNPDGTVQGAAFVDIGVRDNVQGEVVDLAHMNVFICPTANKPDDRFASLDIKSDGRKIYSRVRLSGAADADFEVQFIYRFVDPVVA